MTIKMTILLIGCVMIAGGLLLHFVQSRSASARESALNSKFKKLKEIQKQQAVAAQEKIERSKIDLKQQTDDAVAAVKALSLPAALAELTSDSPNSSEQSRIGGPVYLPENTPYPVDNAGAPMLFLTQINFAEMPAIPGFPAQGILQLFARADEELGIETNERPAQRVIHFWDHVSDLTTRHDAISVHTDMLIYKKRWVDGKQDTSKAEHIHINGRKLKFQASLTDIIPSSTYEYPVPHHLGDKFKEHVHLDDHVGEIIQELNPIAPVMIGGYPRFAQSDPRFTVTNYAKFMEQMMVQETEYTRVLLNMNSVDDLMIWDAGSLNILIRPEDLEKKYFGNIIYEIAGH